MAVTHKRSFPFLSPITVYAPAKFEAIPDAVARFAASEPDRCLLVCEDRTVTRGEFNRRANGVANARLGKLQRISAVEFRDDLPRRIMGKVLKKDLRAPYWAAEPAQA